MLLSPKYKTLYTPAPLILPVPLRPPASVSRIAAQFVGDDLKVVLLVRGDLGMSPGMRVCARVHSCAMRALAAQGGLGVIART